MRQATPTAAMLYVPLLAACIGGCAAPPPRAQHTPSPQPASEPTQSPEPAPAPATAQSAQTAREVFPHVRIDTAARTVEIDGTIPIDAHDARTPRVYLEVFVCTPDSKEHESVVVTRARPSHVHAALLLLGLEPGKPGEWNWENAELRAIPPEGPHLHVDLIEVATGRATPMARCATSVRDQASLADRADGHFVFAGSRVVKRKAGEVYWADGDGTLMGLTSFGGETIAWSEMFSHDSSVEEPHWIADKAVVPPFGSEVVVRISVPKPE